jgi:HEAT repeat protein
MMIVVMTSLTCLRCIVSGITLSLTPVPSPTATAASTGADPAVSGIDPGIVAAWIGAGGALIVALIAAGIAIYQTQRSARQAQELLRLQKKLDTQQAREEREQQRQETEAEAAQAAMQSARTLNERVTAYRQALRADPRIAFLQILDMNRPFGVADIYIRLRLHQQTGPSYHFDQDAERRLDPNALLKASHLRLEQRASTSLAPEEALRIYKHSVIAGDPGAGKTTLLKFLALQAVDQHLVDLPDLPIHVELNAYVNSGYRDLLEFASVVWEERYGFPKTEARDYMQKQLQEGQAILLLDALDETVTGTNSEQAEESYRQVSKAITDVATRYSQAPIVVTVRKAGYHQRSRLAGFTELEVLDFRLDEIKQFVERWFACHPGPHKRGNAAELNAKLERNPRMQALAANPLLLSLIVIVYEDQLDLPERRAELYRRCMETLLTKWDASRNIRRLRAFKVEHKQQLLEEIAWHFHQRRQRYFSERELLEIIAAFLPAIGLLPQQNAEVLNEIAAENGLLKEQAHGWYGFLHLTLQEYCAAQYAVDHQELDALLKFRDDPWWEEVLLLYAGRIPDASPLLQHLLGLTHQNPLPDDLFHTNLILAGRCLAAFPTIRQVPLRQEIIARLFNMLTTSPYDLSRKQSSEALVEIGGRGVNGRLLQMLPNEQIETSVRWGIASALGNLGDMTVVPELMQMLPDEQIDASVRRGIAAALGNLGDMTIVPQLVHMLPDEQIDASVRQSIASALGNLGDMTVAPELVQMLLNKQIETSVRWSIADALGNLGDMTVVPQLVHMLPNEQIDASVRRSIASALGNLGDKTVVPQLVQMLSDMQIDASVRWHIAATLGNLGDKSVVPQLVHMLPNEQIDASVRWDIASALGNLGDKSVVPQLVHMLPNEQIDASVRWQIAATLGNLGDKTIVPQLVQMLPNKQIDAFARRSIASALGTLGDKTVVPELVHMLPNKQIYTFVRQSIADALASLLDDERSVRDIAAILLQSDIANSIHRLLWTVSRQIGVRIFVSDGPGGKQLEVVKRPK